MAPFTYEVFNSAAITEEMVDEAAQFFREHFQESCCRDTPWTGTRTPLPADELDDEVLSTPTTVHARATWTTRPMVVGHVFACRWLGAAKRVCWITQIVVHPRFRDYGVAAGLVQRVRRKMDQVVGILTPNPRACLAVANGCKWHPASVLWQYNLVAPIAQDILDTSPIDYLRTVRADEKIFNVLPDELRGVSPKNCAEMQNEFLFMIELKPRPVPLRFGPNGRKVEEAENTDA